MKYTFGRVIVVMFPKKKNPVITFLAPRNLLVRFLFLFLLVCFFLRRLFLPHPLLFQGMQSRFSQIEEVVCKIFFRN